MKELHLLMGYPFSEKNHFVEDLNDPVIDIETIKTSLLNSNREKVNWNPLVYRMVLHLLRTEEYESRKVFIKDYLLDRKTRQWFVKVAQKHKAPVYLYTFPTHLPSILQRAKRTDPSGFENVELLRLLHKSYDFPLKEEGFDDIIYIQEEEEINI